MTAPHRRVPLNAGSVSPKKRSLNVQMETARDRKHLKFEGSKKNTYTHYSIYDGFLLVGSSSQATRRVISVTPH